MIDTRFSLADVAPGFADPVQATQRVFRTLLDAMARPGTCLLYRAPRPRALSTSRVPGGA